MLGSLLGIPPERYHALKEALTLIAAQRSKLITSSGCIEALIEGCGIKCVAGEKASRVFNKVCREYGLDKHPEYNARFAKLADALNPLQVHKTALLSVHPCDYLEMSNTSNSWSSCHNLYDGCYRAGTVSYLMDACSMVFYTVEDGRLEHSYGAPKTTREMFCYDRGVLLQSRLYPNTNDDDTKEAYRNIVQRIITECLGLPNLWHLHRSMSAIHDHTVTSDGALHYPDYIYEEYGSSVSLLEGVAGEDSKLFVGAKPICMYCADYLCDEDSILCSDCDEGTVCAACGSSISDDDIYEVGEECYCQECVSYCDLCCHYVRGDITYVLTVDRRSLECCEECLEDSTDTCSVCGEIYVRRAVTEIDGVCYCPSCVETLVESTPA